MLEISLKTLEFGIKTSRPLKYDTIEEITWTRKLSIQLYLAHVTRKKTKTNKSAEIRKDAWKYLKVLEFKSSK